MFLLTVIMFAIIYAVISAVSYYFGIGNFYFYLFLSFAIMFVQYMIGPRLVEWSMRVKYLKDGQEPRLRNMVTGLAANAGIPVPRIGIAEINIPNAFAFGRWRKDGRVCATRGILNLLSDDELKAVMGHEISHLKNRDVLTITLLSVIPIILYRMAWHFMFAGNRRDRGGGNAAIIGLLAFLFYFLTNLLVLYASRIREYFADKGSVDLGNRPASLASALYKLVYGSARMPKEAIKDAEGLKAFFVNDPSRAVKELRDLRQLDTDGNGAISAEEMRAIQTKEIRLGFGDKLMEILSTHPNMVKRVKRLSALE